MARFDVLGFVTIATGLVSLLLALTEGQTWGWTSYRIIILFAVSVVSLALFVVIELEVENPLLDVRVFANLRLHQLAALDLGAVGGPVRRAVLHPAAPPAGPGARRLRHGTALLPQALVMGVLMPTAGIIYDKFGPRWPAAIGLALTAVGTYLLTEVTLESSNASVVWLLVLRSVGMGLSMMPIMTGGIAAVPPSMVDGRGRSTPSCSAPPRRWAWPRSPRWSRAPAPSSRRTGARSSRPTPPCPRSARDRRGTWRACTR